MMAWKLSLDGKTVSRVLDNGMYECRLVTTIPDSELATALPADQPALEDIKAARMAYINQACSAEIVAGFDSSALGSVHHYTATLEDQANLSGLILLGVDDAFTCVNASGIKAMRPHSIAQLKQVLADGAAAKKSCLVRARLLKDEVAVAADSVSLDAIIW